MQGMQVISLTISVSLPPFVFYYILSVTEGNVWLKIYLKVCKWAICPLLDKACH